VKIAFVVNDKWKLLSGYGLRFKKILNFLRNRFEVKVLEITRRKYKIDFNTLNSECQLLGKGFRSFLDSLKTSSVVIAEGLFPSFICSLLVSEKTIYDIHGIAEEAGQLRLPISRIIERLAFKRLKNFIAVSNTMLAYISEKYDISHDKNTIVIPTYDERIDTTMLVNNYETSRKRLAINPENIVIIYSGGVQKWQNIPVVINIINKAVISNENVIGIVLTNTCNHRFFEQKLSRSQRIKITYATGNMIENYYNAANYGLIPRTANNINKVSCPTKMIDYIKYGIKPIIIDKFGDFFDFSSLEYLKLPIDYKELSNSKSLTNATIYNNYFAFDSNRQRLLINFIERMGIANER